MNRTTTTITTKETDMTLAVPTIIRTSSRTTKNPRVKPLDLAATADARSFLHMPWADTGAHNLITRVVGRTDDRQRELTEITFRIGSPQVGIAYDAPETDEERRVCRLLLVAPAMFAALKLVRERGTVPDAIGKAIDLLVESVG